MATNMAKTIYKSPNILCLWWVLAPSASRFSHESFKITYFDPCMVIPEKAFASLSVIPVVDLLQLPLVREKLLFSRFSDKDIYLACSYGIYLKERKMINSSATCLIKFESIQFMMMLKSYSRQDLHINLLKTIQKISCTC